MRKRYFVSYVVQFGDKSDFTSFGNGVVEVEPPGDVMAEWNAQVRQALLENPGLKIGEANRLESETLQFIVLNFQEL